MIIEFGGEAAENYHMMLKNLVGCGCEVTTNDDKTIEGIITAVSDDEPIWYGTIYMQRGFESTGEIVKVVAEKVKVY